jgi:organic radical activating enzyme
MRTMKLVANDGPVLYESFFDPETGNTVRTVEERTNRWDKPVMSPSPEIVDISITNRCNFGCPYCYMNSKPRLKHGSTDLVETILLGFKHVPYQIAIGGGEPTMHPELPAILRGARELGTVPNYTTNGKHLSPALIKATNEFCGGVAMTYHEHKGFDWFRERYQEIRTALTCQVNVHLLADRNVGRTLDELIRLSDEMPQPINLVLLAYDPEVGRAKPDRLMTRTTYTRTLPKGIKRALGHGMPIAFSEGLLPYFLSRPEIGINTKFATAAEGVFSCYFDSRGRIFPSSFKTWDIREDKTALQVDSQQLWNEMHRYGHYNGGESCYDCPHETQCSTSNDVAYFICARAPHNKLPLETSPEPEPERKRALDRLLTFEED